MLSCFPRRFDPPHLHWFATQRQDKVPKEKITPDMNGAVDQDLASAFRQHLPDLKTPRFQISSQQSPYEYSEAFQKNHVPPWLYNLTQAWKELLEEPYTGVTSDGGYTYR